MYDVSITVLYTVNTVYNGNIIHDIRVSLIFYFPTTGVNCCWTEHPKHPLHPYHGYVVCIIFRHACYGFHLLLLLLFTVNSFSLFLLCTLNGFLLLFPLTLTFYSLLLLFTLHSLCKEPGNLS